MISALKILAVAALWYIKSSSLPKFYFKQINSGKSSCLRNFIFL